MPRPDDLWRLASSLAGDRGAASRLEFIASAPNDPRAVSALMDIAESLLAAGRAQRSLGHLRLVRELARGVAAAPPGQVAQGAGQAVALQRLVTLSHFKEAQAYLRLGQGENALQALAASLAAASPQAPEYGDAALLRAEVLERLQRLDDAALAYHEFLLAAAAHPGREAARAALQRLIEERLSVSTLRALARQATPPEAGGAPPFPASLALLRAAELLFAGGKGGDAEVTLAEWQARFPESPEAERARALRHRLQEWRAQQLARLAVLLPLSGALAEVGASGLRGVQLAFALTPGADRVLLVVQDSEGDAQRTAVLVGELASNARVLAGIGPLLPQTAAAAVPVAERAGLPLITPGSSAAELPLATPVFYRAVLTVEDEVNALARLAVQNFAKTAAVLHPATQEGRRLRDLFATAFNSYGGVVIDTEPYDPQANDFSRAIRNLGGREDDELQALGGSPSEREEQFRLPYQLLFIAGRAPQVSLIAPQLAFFNIRRVQLLGTQGWNEPGLLRGGKEYLEGSIFSSEFFPGSERPEVQQFVREYRSMFRSEPTLLAARTYDIARVLLDLLVKGIDDRAALHKALATVVEHQGVTGRFSIGSDGVFHKSPTLLHVRKGKIVERPPALEWLH
ncbi:MAG: penicillin-binding protein activator [Candidatus Tectomicrobia bacterium]|nr:penicillin-binding protein activator [Candidatus Tectomicrobia bacterium]